MQLGAKVRRAEVKETYNVVPGFAPCFSEKGRNQVSTL